MRSGREERLGVCSVGVGKARKKETTNESEE